MATIITITLKLEREGAEAEAQLTTQYYFDVPKDKLADAAASEIAQIEEGIKIARELQAQARAGQEMLPANRRERRALASTRER